MVSIFTDYTNYDVTNSVIIWHQVDTRGVARNLFWGYKFLRRYKTSTLMCNSRSDVILPYKQFTWTDFGGTYTHIPPSLRPWWTPGLCLGLWGTQLLLETLEVLRYITSSVHGGKN